MKKENAYWLLIIASLPCTTFYGHLAYSAEPNALYLLVSLPVTMLLVSPSILKKDDWLHRLNMAIGIAAVVFFAAGTVLRLQNVTLFDYLCSPAVKLGIIVSFLAASLSLLLFALEVNTRQAKTKSTQVE